mgnify:CR=1 FL=1
MESLSCTPRSLPNFLGEKQKTPVLPCSAPHFRLKFHPKESTGVNFSFPVMKMEICFSMGYDGSRIRLPLFIEQYPEGHVALEDALDLVGAFIKEHVVEILVLEYVPRLAKLVQYVVNPPEHILVGQRLQDAVPGKGQLQEGRDPRKVILFPALYAEKHPDIDIQLVDDPQDDIQPGIGLPAVFNLGQVPGRYADALRKFRQAPAPFLTLRLDYLPNLDLQPAKPPFPASVITSPRF